VKKIKTESGVWIPATYKTGKYKQWKDRSKADDQEDEDGEEAGAQQNRPHIKGNYLTDLPTSVFNMKLL
jgi:DBP10CT (NUC160) domain